MAVVFDLKLVALILVVFFYSFLFFNCVFCLWFCKFDFGSAFGLGFACGLTGLTGITGLSSTGSLFIHCFSCLYLHVLKLTVLLHLVQVILSDFFILFFGSSLVSSSFGASSLTSSLTSSVSLTSTIFILDILI